jgi:hypothetical protein
MQKQPSKKRKTPNQLELGDQVQYTVNTNTGPFQRIGKIIFIDGPWFVVQNNEENWVWVSLQCS